MKMKKIQFNIVLILFKYHYDIDKIFFKYFKGKKWVLKQEVYNPKKNVV